MSAIEMFLKLDYKLIRNDEDRMIYVYIYNHDCDIYFDKKEKYIYGLPNYDGVINMDLLKAFNKQCEELGWL